MDTHETNGSESGIPQNGGSGGDAREHPRLSQVRADSGLTGIREQRMIDRAMKGGWTGVKRWNTDITSEAIQQRMVESNGQLTLKERTLLAVMNGVTSTDARVSGIAARNVIAMESQNLADEHKQLPDLHLNIHKMAEDEKKDRLASLLEAAKARKAHGNGEANGSGGVAV